jgi:hypothetical protein
MTIYEIEQSVAKLPLDELARFREWFEEFNAKVWDEQFEHDAMSGKLDALANDALADFHAGEANEL